MSAKQDLIAKYNAQEVGGMLVVRINNRNEYMGSVNDAGYTLTDLGKKLEAGELKVDAAPEAAAPAEPAAPAKAKSKKPAAAAEPEQGDLFAGLDE